MQDKAIHAFNVCLCDLFLFHRVVRSLPPSNFPTWDRVFTTEGLLLFYDAGNGNIFTKDRLQLIQTIEDKLVSVAKFSSYCQMTQTGTCKTPVSVLRFFDGTYASVDSVFNDTTFDNIANVLYAAYTYNETKGAFVYALGKTNVVSSSSVTSTLTRTLIPFGWPLSGYRSAKDMTTALVEFVANYMKPVLESYLDSSLFEFVFYNNELMYYEVKQQALLDMALACGSMVFIFCFILFHTRSLWVTCFAVLSIVCSFVETNFIYRVVIGFRYFGYFHVLAMFIILGIGADDLFVFWDAWKATGLKKHPSLAHRLNEAYRKSVISMLVTSVTTMTAFLANALSPLLATRSFGVFAAMLIGIDYLAVITFFPTIVIFYHTHFEDKPHPCCSRCCGKRKEEQADEEDVTGKHSTDGNPESVPNGPATIPTVSQTLSGKNSVSTFPGASGCVAPNKLTRNGSRAWFAGTRTPDVNQNTKTKTDRRGLRSEAALQENDKNKPNRLVIFFRDYYFAFVTHKIARWVIVVLLLGCLVAFAVSATKLEPDNEQVRLTGGGQ